MEIKDKELHRVATTCIIYNSEGKYLVTKRSPHKKMQPNKWTVPGGGLNVDDYINRPKSYDAPQWYGSLESALLREVKEENIAEKELGIKEKKQIEEMGVDKFNEFCRSKVLAFASEWKKTRFLKNLLNLDLRINSMFSMMAHLLLLEFRIMGIF